MPRGRGPGDHLARQLDQAAACPVGHGKAVGGYGTRAGVAAPRRLDLTSCMQDAVVAQGESTAIAGFRMGAPGFARW
jgi:hypothetical protein